MKNMYCEHLGISEDVYNYGQNVIKELKERFDRIDEIAEYNQLKVLSAMQKNKVAEMHLYGTGGYGYNDEGRDTLERFRRCAMCRRSSDSVSTGTHAIHTGRPCSLPPCECQHSRLHHKP